MVDKALDVEAILAGAKPSVAVTTEVHKDSPYTMDLGLFTLSDSLPLDDQVVLTEDKLKEITRDNTQLFVNALFSLPTRREELGVIADLPAITTPMPREKPLPKDKPATRWEKFAKEKGIVKQKRSRMVFDEQAQDWKPRYGFNRANDDQKDWLVEVPQNGDIFEDQFEKRREDKKARIAKNKANQVKNLERTAAQRIMASLPAPNTKGKNPVREVRKVELKRQLTSTKTSTASFGRFDKAIENEPKIKEAAGKKRKFDSTTGSLGSEHERASTLADSLIKRVASGDPIKRSRK